MRLFIDSRYWASAAETGARIGSMPEKPLGMAWRILRAPVLRPTCCASTARVRRHRWRSLATGRIGVRRGLVDPPRAVRRPVYKLEFVLMATGTVKWFNAQKGYGFIQPTTGGADVFVHISAVEQAGMDGLNEGQKITYELEQGQRGRVSAVNLRPA